MSPSTAVVFVAAIVAVSVWSWRREGLRYRLESLAIERGVYLPGGLPVWVVSLRRGLMTLVFGVALLIVGALSWSIGNGVATPEADAAVAVTQPVAIAPPDIDRRGLRPAPPPPPNPAMERWHEARQECTAGLAAMGIGVVLALLGAAQAAFARAERKYTLAAGDSVERPPVE